MADKVGLGGNTNEGVKEPTREEKEFDEFLEYCTERVSCINNCYGSSISQYTVDTQNGMCDSCHKINENK
jgi:hypothetical protein